MPRLLTTLAIALGTSIAAAQPVSIFSFKDTSCGAWVRSGQDQPTRQVYLFWFRGFVSGFNTGSALYEVPLSAMPDPDTLALYVDKFCRDEPLSDFTSAAFRLVDEQKRRRVKS